MNVEKKIQQELTADNFDEWFEANQNQLQGFSKTKKNTRKKRRRSPKRCALKIAAVACAALVVCTSIGSLYYVSKFENFAVGIRIAKDVIADIKSAFEEYQRKEAVATVASFDNESRDNTIAKGMDFPEFDEGFYLQEQSRAIAYCDLAVEIYETNDLKEGNLYSCFINLGPKTIWMSFTMQYSRGVLEMGANLAIGDDEHFKGNVNHCTLLLSVKYDQTTDSYSSYTLSERRVSESGAEYIDIRHQICNDVPESYDPRLWKNLYYNFNYKYGVSNYIHYTDDHYHSRGFGYQNFDIVQLGGYMHSPDTGKNIPFGEYIYSMQHALDMYSLKASAGDSCEVPMEYAKEIFKNHLNPPESVKMIFYHKIEFEGEYYDANAWYTCMGDAYLTDDMINILPYQTGEHVIQDNNFMKFDMGEYVLEGIYLNEAMTVPWPEEGILYEDQPLLGVWLKWKRIATF